MASKKRNSAPAANHLRAWREYRGLSQTELAEKSDTAPNVISLLESGGRGLSDKWLRKLAPILGTSPGFLLDHDPFQMSDFDRELLDTAREIPKAKQDEALAILRILRQGR